MIFSLVMEVIFDFLFDFLVIKHPLVGAAILGFMLLIAGLGALVFFLG